MPLALQAVEGVGAGVAVLGLHTDIVSMSALLLQIERIFPLDFFGRFLCWKLEGKSPPVFSTGRPGA
jgi:hypothetical protein